MREGVFIADDVSARPPAGEIGVRGVCDQNPPKAAVWPFLNIQRQFIYAFKVEDEATLTAINLEPVMILPLAKRDPSMVPTAPFSNLARERGIVYVYGGVAAEPRSKLYLNRQTRTQGFHDSKGSPGRRR